MGISVKLSDSQNKIVTEAFDSIIDEWGVPCKIVYPPKISRCNNCVYSNITNKSSGKWLTGGPAQFPMGAICPVCGGNGTVAIENYDIINLFIIEDPKKFIKIANVAIPDGAIQTKGYLKDLPKIFSSNYMVKDINLLPYREYRYTLFGEPIVPGNIIQDRYFLATWAQ